MTGPVAKPRTKRAVPKLITSIPTSKSRLAWLIAGEKIALFKDAINVPEQANIEDISLVIQ
jgi:hypothetical protein